MNGGAAVPASHNAPPRSLTARTAHGMSWSFLSTVISMVATLGVTAVLARLLTPAAFGLVAMAGVILRFGAYFAQLGVGTALVQRGDLNKEHIRACLSVSLVLGLVFGALFYFLGPFIARVVFDSGGLAPVIQVLALSFVLDSLSVTAIALLRRRMDFRWLAITDVSAYLLGYAVVSVGMALAGAGVWSLVAGALTQSGLVAILAYSRVRHPLGLSLDWRTYKQLLSYGGRVSLIGFLEFLGYSIEPVAIGRYLGSTQVGFFSTVQRLSTYPVERVVTSTTRVLFPSLSLVQGEPTRFARGYSASYSAAGLFSVPAALFMSVAAREVVAVLLGPQWAGAVTPLRLIALAVPFTILSHINGVSLDALARLTGKLVANVAYLCIGVALVAFGLRFGVLGVIAAYVTLEALYWAATLGLVQRALPARPVSLVSLHGGMLLVGGTVSVATLAATGLGRAVGLASLGTLVLQMLCALVGLAVFSVLPLEAVRRDMRAIADVLAATRLSTALPLVGKVVSHFKTPEPEDSRSPVGPAPT